MMIIICMVIPLNLAKGNIMPPLINENHLAIMTIWQEARGESLLGKIAVATVIRNRMSRKYNSNGSIAGTVLAPYQFSGWNTDDKTRPLSTQLDTDNPVVQDCQLSWNLSENVDKFPAVLFHATSIPAPSWAKSDKVKQIAVIGNHVFYTDES